MDLATTMLLIGTLAAVIGALAAVVAVIIQLRKNGNKEREERTVLAQRARNLFRDFLYLLSRPLRWLLPYLDPTFTRNGVKTKVEDKAEESLAKEAGQERLESLGFEKIEVLPNTKEVSRYLGMLRVEKNVSKITPRCVDQTHIRSGSVPPSIDIVRSYLDLPIEERPFIERFILITRPLDINFATHSVELSKKYGPARIGLTILFEELEFVPSYPNLTLISWPDPTTNEVLLTFPFLQLPPVKSSQEDHTTGLVFRSNEVYRIAEGFMDMTRHMANHMLHKRSSSEVLDRAKQELWKFRRSEYYRAVAISIKDEIVHDAIVFEKPGQYIGIVGSARVDSGEAAQDVDIVIILDEPPSKNEYDDLRACVVRVLKRYSSPSVEFRAVWELNPVKQRDISSTAAEVFPIHLLVNTLSTVSRWSPFIAWHRECHRENLEGEFPATLVPKGFTKTELLEEYHGINSLLRSLQDNEVEDMAWVEEASKMVRESRSISLSSPASRYEFLRYAVKWTARNLLSVKEPPLREEETVNEKENMGRLFKRLGLGKEVKTNLERILTGEIPPEEDIEKLQESAVELLEAAAKVCKDT